LRFHEAFDFGGRGFGQDNWHCKKLRE
jgi:hypothetical protein